VRLTRQPSAMIPAVCAAQFGKVWSNRRSNSRHVVATAAVIRKADKKSDKWAALFRRGDEHVGLAVALSHDASPK
jgi:hypothetical protein